MPSDHRMVFYQGPGSSHISESRQLPSSQQPSKKQPTSTQQWVRFKEYQPKPKPPKKKKKRLPSTDDDDDDQDDDHDHDHDHSDNTATQSRSSANRIEMPVRHKRGQLVKRQQPVDPTTSQHLLVLPQVLSSSDPDPFNALPSKTDPYAARMLQLYIDKSCLTAVFSRSTPEVSNLWLEQRKQHWLPLAMGSPAALNALIVFMASCPGMPAADPFNQRRRLAAAYNALNEDLKHADRQALDSTAFAVVLLMNAAEHMDDFAAFRSHTAGLEAIVARRRNLPYSVLPTTRPDMAHIEANLRALEARNLVRPELLTHLRYWHASAMSWRVVGRDEKILTLSSSHMMTTGLCFGGQLWPIEAAFSETLKLNGARMFRNKTPTIGTGFKLQSCIGFIRARLDECALDELVDSAPDFLLWIALVVGPVSQEQDTTLYFARLLRRTVYQLGGPGYAEVQEVVRKQAFLPTPFDELSAAFWAEFMDREDDVEEVEH